MKTKVFLVVFFLACSLSVKAQLTGPAIEWQNTIGGSGWDELFSAEQTSDGGYILGGISDSDISGDKTETTSGTDDYWVVKLDTAGNIEWQNTIGGSSYDWLFSVQQISDGGYILGGHSQSGISGDKAEVSIGSWDYWVVKLDSAGEIEWQNTIGGNSWDYLYSIHQTFDGGYVLGGYSYSGISGDKTEASLGDYDYWVVKLNHAGEIEWQNTIGGSSGDHLRSISPTTDGGYLLGGESSSGISGDKTEASSGSDDYWVVKLNGTGDIEWQNTIGGSNTDELKSIGQTFDGGYILGGYSFSDISGDKAEASLGSSDYWVIKLNDTGVIEWQNTIGGSDGDYLRSLQQTIDEGYILGGESYSDASGDKTEASLGDVDYWIVKLNNTGAIEWQNTIGGNSEDYFSFIRQTSNWGYILSGFSNSGISGDKTEASLGYDDYWVIKLEPDVCGGITVFADVDGDNYGDAGNTYFATDCIVPPGYLLNNTDCNDNNASVNPSATEACNNIDDDCDNNIDEGALLTFYADNDGDNYGTSSSSVEGCVAPLGFVSDSTDCNDNNVTINPAATEICNDVDDNCDGYIDEGTLLVFYADADGDLFGTSTSSVEACSAPLGYVPDSTDCDDSKAAINPAAIEICNDVDDNCDSNIDEGLLLTFYADADGDLFGTSTSSTEACNAPSGYVPDSTDCDDTNANINPDALEISNNSIDDDCDGDVDEFGVGISETHDGTFQIRIFPNPASNYLSFELTNLQPQSLSIRLCNVLGTEVIKSEKEEVNGIFSSQLDLRNLPSGTYLLRIMNGEQTEMRKVIIEK